VFGRRACWWITRLTSNTTLLNCGRPPDSKLPRKIVPLIERNVPAARSKSENALGRTVKFRVAKAWAASGTPLTMPISTMTWRLCGAV